MRRISASALLSVALAGLLGCAATFVSVHPRHRAVHVNVSFFYQELAPYGHWFHHGHRGWVWVPYRVGYGWRPYSHGHWVYSQFGWTWVSDWPWGWAPFHYGRWVFDPDYGWVWIPGHVWAPAWVVWRWGGGWIGWAPLPPDVRWKAGVGLAADVGPAKWKIHTPGWSFVRERWMVDSRLPEKLAPPARNGTLLGISRVVSNYDEFERQPRNRGPSVDMIGKVVRSYVPRHRLTETDSPRDAGRSGPNGELRVFRPQITPLPAGAPEVVPRNVEGAARPAPGIQTKEQKRLDNTFRRQSEKLRIEQRAEQRKPPKGLDKAELARRQKLERRALAEQRARQEKILQRRVKEGIVKPETKAKPQAKPERKEKPERKAKPERKR